MKLRGTEPVDSIDLSSKRLTVLSATIIASLIGSNAATKSLKYAAPFPSRLTQVSAALAKCQQPLTL